MKHIKTWSERCEEHPDHQHGMISKSMIQARMQEEIDELRQALGTKREWVGLTDEEIQEVVSKKWWDWEDAFDIEGFSRAIERVLKEKNHD